MRKIFRIFTGVFSLAYLLQSCRNEDIAMEEQKQSQQIQEFAVFKDAMSKSTANGKFGKTAQSEDADAVYQEGFNYLYKRYYDLHVPQSQKEADQQAVEQGAEAIDLRYASPLFEQNGYLYVIFPTIKNGQVENLVFARVNAENTIVGYFTMEKNEYVRAYIAEFEAARNSSNFTNKTSQASGGGCVWVGDHYECGSVGDVIITVPTPKNPPSNIGGGGGGGGNGHADGSPVHFEGNCSEYEGCGGSGGFPNNDNDNDNHDNEPQEEDPCQKAAQASSKANGILGDKNVQSGMTGVLEGAVGSGKESAVSVGGKFDASGNATSVAVSLPQQGGEFSGNVPATPNGYSLYADGHNHTGGGVPSACDFYGMIGQMQGSNNPYYTARFVFGQYYGQPETYALMVTDRQAVANFLSNAAYSEANNVIYYTAQDGTKQCAGFNRTGDIGYAYWNAKDMPQNYDYDATGYNQTAIAMAQMLNQFNAGIILAKEGADGKMHAVNTERGSFPDPGNTTSNPPTVNGITAIPCPQ